VALLSAGAATFETFHDGLYDDVVASHVEPLWSGAEPDSPPTEDPESHTK